MSEQLPDDGLTAYQAWFHTCLTALARDLPAFRVSAERAAARYVGGREEIGAYGEPGFAWESNGRAGGLIHMRNPRQIDGPAGGEVGILLVAPRDDAFAADCARARAWQDEGRLVIGFGRPSQVAAMRRQGIAETVPTHAAPHGGLFPGPAGRVIPTEPVANICALWVWLGEFLAACTRLGKMPVVYQSFAVPGARAWAESLAETRFFDRTPDPLPFGSAGTQFLTAMRAGADALFAQEGARMRAVAERALAVRAAGGACYAYLYSHALLPQFPCAHDPGYFAPMNTNWLTMREELAFQPGDLTLWLVYDTILQGERYRYYADRVRETGASLIWSLASYRPEEIASLPPEELFIDQHWEYGDAVVTLPGVELPIAPTSGALGELLLWSICAAMWTRGAGYSPGAGEAAGAGDAGAFRAPCLTTT